MYMPPFRTTMKISPAGVFLLRPGEGYGIRRLLHQQGLAGVRVGLRSCRNASGG